MLEYWLKIVLINFYFTDATSSYYTYPIIKQENNKTQLHVRCALVYLILNWNHTIHPFIGEGISFYPGVVIAIN